MVPPCTESDLWLSPPDTVLIYSHCMAATVFPLHVLGAYCILKKTPANMKSMKWTLLNFHFWNVVMDLMLKVFTIPFTLWPSASGGLLRVLSMMGVSLKIQCWALVMSVSLTLISTMMIFENRFRLLNSKNVCWKKFQPFWVLFNVLFCFVLLIPTMLNFPDQTHAREMVVKTFPCIPYFLNSLEIIVPSLDSSVIVTTSIVLIIFVFGQLTIFALIIIKQLWTNFGVNNLSQNTRRLQKMLLKALVWQIGIPMMYVVLPTAGSMIVISQKIYNMVLNNVVLATVSFHGLVSTLSMILIHQPYRHTVMFWIKHKKTGDTTKHAFAAVSPNTVVEVNTII